MRQNAVSSAPQNEPENQIAATIATIPTVVEDSRTRRRPSSSVDSAASGNSRWRSSTTDASTSSEARIRPATNSPTRASGKTERIMLYATIAAMPVRLSSYDLRQKVASARSMRALWRLLGVEVRPALAGHDLGNAQPELLVDHDDLAAGDRLAVDQQVDRLAREAVQRDDRAGAERERLADRHARAADLDGELDGDVAQPLEVVRDVGGHAVARGDGRLERDVVDGLGRRRRIGHDGGVEQ